MSKKKRFDIIKYGVKPSIFLHKISKILKFFSVFFIIFIMYLFFIRKNNMNNIAFYILILLLIAFFLSDYWLPLFWIKLLDSGIDNEMPAFLAFLIPYASTSKNLTDLMLMFPKSLNIKFIKYEIDRLKILLGIESDFRKALNKLNETTPNKRLKRFLTDYMQAETMGTSRYGITSLLYKHAMLSLRDKWNSYTELGKEFAEISIGIVLGMGALAPLIMISSPNLVLMIFLLGILFISLISLLLLFIRPNIGEPLGNNYITSGILIMPLLASFLLLIGYNYLALAFLAVTSSIIEINYFRLNKKVLQALTNLRIASEKAKLGKRFDIELLRSRIIAGNVIDAIISAEKIAGKTGTSHAIEGLSMVIDEAKRLSKSLSSLSLLMIGFSIISPGISLIIINVMSSVFPAMSQFINLNLNTVILTKKIILSLSPLSPLPISILHRGKQASLIPSLISFMVSLILFFKF